MSLGFFSKFSHAVKSTIYSSMNSKDPEEFTQRVKTILDSPAKIKQHQGNAVSFVDHAVDMAHQ